MSTLQDPASWLALRRLLENALDLPPDERPAFVDRLAGPDADFRAELRDLLRAEGSAQDVASQTAIDYVTGAIKLDLKKEAGPEPHELRPIGPYQPIRLLGRGGMGAVYLAERTESKFTHLIAVKVVKALGSHPDLIERFERERQILARLNHPSIALLFDVGRTAEGDPYFTMEYVSGQTVVEYCRERLHLVRQRVQLLLRIANAIAYAHQQLIAHRDIKPSNILVTARGEPKLLDFGVAKLLDVQPGNYVTSTTIGPMTPTYAAPEQFSGAGTDAATDIYQFGVLCYEALTGCLPYRADPGNALQWAIAVVEQEPITLGSAMKTPAAKGSYPKWSMNVRRQLTRDLDAILRKAMAKVPTDRYRSMDALIADLEAYLSERPVTAREGAWHYRLSRFLLRWRWAVLAWLLIDIAGLSAVFEALSASAEAQRANEMTTLLRMERNKAQDDARSSRIANEVLNNIFRTAVSASASGGEQNKHMLQQAELNTIKLLESSPMQRDIAAATLAAAHLSVQQMDECREILELALKTSPGAGPAGALERARLQLVRARLEITSNSLSRGESMLDAAALAFPAPLGARDQARVSATRVDLLQRKGDVGRARELRDQVVELMQSKGLTDEPLLSKLLSERAADHEMTNDVKRARADLARAVVVAQEAYGPLSPTALDLQRQRMWLEIRAGNPDAAQQMLDQQREVILSTFGPDSLEYVGVLAMEGNWLGETGNTEGAERNFRAALAIAQRRQPEGSRYLEVLNHNLGDIAFRQNRPHDALKAYQAALALRRRTSGPDDQEVAINELQIARTQCKLGNYETALQGFSDVRRKLGRIYAPHHEHLQFATAAHVDCLLDSGASAQAKVLFETELTPDVRPALSARMAPRIEAVRKRLASAVHQEIK